mgnify:CR=1 FL=1
MTEKQLLQTLQTVDSKYTAEVKERIAQAQASGKRSRRIGMKPIILTAGAAAACLCVSMAALMPKDPDMTVANSDIKEQIALEEPETEQEPAEAAAVTTALATTANKDSTAKTTAAVTQKNAKSSSAAQTKASGAANASKTTGTTSKNTKNTKQESTAKNTGSTASKTTGNAGGQLNVIPTADKSTTVTLPDFTGMSFAEAQKLAKSLRISLKATERVSPKAKGTVLEQLTFAGRKVSVNTEFEVYTATGGNEVVAMGDCAINIHPTEDELVEICHETAECAKVFGVEPKVAFLSFSTNGSAKDPDVTKMINATAKAKKAFPDLPIDGELQFDAAVSPVVAKTKVPGWNVAGHANTFIFPDINAGNIGYKIAQRFGNFDAYGPILLGLNAPINDLSRGCNADEVYSMAIVTAALA